AVSERGWRRPRGRRWTRGVPGGGLDPRTHEVIQPSPDEGGSLYPRRRGGQSEANTSRHESGETSRETNVTSHSKPQLQLCVVCGEPIDPHAEAASMAVEQWDDDPAEPKLVQLEEPVYWHDRCMRAPRGQTRDGRRPNCQFCGGLIDLERDEDIVQDCV